MLSPASVVAKMNGRDSICKVIIQVPLLLVDIYHSFLRPLIEANQVLFSILTCHLCASVYSIDQADLEEVTSLYLDAKSSAKLLQEQQEKYIS